MPLNNNKAQSCARSKRINRLHSAFITCGHGGRYYRIKQIQTRADKRICDLPGQSYIRTFTVGSKGSDAWFACLVRSRKHHISTRHQKSPSHIRSQLPTWSTFCTAAHSRKMTLVAIASGRSTCCGPPVDQRNCTGSKDRITLCVVTRETAHAFIRSKRAVT